MVYRFALVGLLLATATAAQSATTKKIGNVAVAFDAQFTQFVNSDDEFLDVDVDISGNVTVPIFNFNADNPPPSDAGEAEIAGQFTYTNALIAGTFEYLVQGFALGIPGDVSALFFINQIDNPIGGTQNLTDDYFSLQMNVISWGPEFQDRGQQFVDTFTDTADHVGLKTNPVPESGSFAYTFGFRFEYQDEIWSSHALTVFSDGSQFTTRAPTLPTLTLNAIPTFSAAVPIPAGLLLGLTALGGLAATRVLSTRRT